MHGPLNVKNTYMSKHYIFTFLFGKLYVVKHNCFT